MKVILLTLSSAGFFALASCSPHHHTATDATCPSCGAAGCTSCAAANQ